MKTNNFARLVWLDNLRAILIVALVFLHITTDETFVQFSSEESLQIWDSINSILTPIRMPLFFFIAGLMSQNTLSQDWSQLLRKSSRKFLYLSLIWGSFVGLILITLRMEFDLDSFWLAFTETTWFLLALALYFPLTKLSNKIGHLLAPSIGIIAFFISAPSLSSGFSLLGSLSFYYFYFAVGSFSKKYIFENLNRISWKLAFAAGMFFTMSAILMFLSPLGILDAVARFATNAFAVVMSVSFGVKLLDKPTELISRIGRNTIGIYLVNSLAVAFIAGALLYLSNFDSSFRLNWIGGIMLSAIGIVMSLVAAFVIKRLDSRFGLYLLKDPFQRLEKPK